MAPLMAVCAAPATCAAAPSAASACRRESPTLEALSPSEATLLAALSSGTLTLPPTAVLLKLPPLMPLMSPNAAPQVT